MVPRSGALLLPPAQLWSEGEANSEAADDDDYYHTTTTTTTTLFPSFFPLDFIGPAIVLSTRKNIEKNEQAPALSLCEERWKSERESSVKDPIQQPSGGFARRVLKLLEGE